MGKASHRIRGFLWALIIAIVSFFVIYLFFPDVSYKFFGVSVKQPVGKTVTEAAGKVADKVSESVNDAVSSAVSNTVSNITDAISDSVSDAVSNISTK